MPDEREFLCGDWAWDAALKELSHYPRIKKGHAEKPDAVERLEVPRAVRLHTWSQQPMQTSTGEVMPARQARVVVEYADGRKLDVNEPDRDCVARIAAAVAEAYGVPVERLGAPSGRRPGNLPGRDEMGRLVHKSRRAETVLDETAGTLLIKRKKSFFRKQRREIRTNDIRRLELVYDVEGASERFTVYAVAGSDQERIPVAGYTGLEGWADPAEWRDFAKDMASRLGVDLRTADGPWGTIPVNDSRE